MRISDCSSDVCSSDLNDTHRLALVRAARLVLMRLVSDKQVERTLRQIAFDELGGLVAAFTKTELHAGHRALHPLRLPVGKNQLPPVVHQIDEVMQVVTQHRGQKAITEHLHQFLRSEEHTSELQS